MSITTLQKPKYEVRGQSLTLPYEIVQLGVNDGGLGRDVVERTNEAFKGDQNVELDISGLGRNRPIGYSNIFRRYAWAQEARNLAPELFLPNPALYVALLQNGAVPDVNITYEDLGIVINDPKGLNHELKQHLLKQLKDRGIDAKLPIEIHDFKTMKDDNFLCGLRLDLADDVDVREFPGKLGESGIKIYFADNGLRRLYRGRGLGLDADDDSLPVSNEAGRVSFVKGAAPKNLETTLAEIEALKRKRVAELEAAHKITMDEANARFKQAMKVYKG